MPTIYRGFGLEADPFTMLRSIQREFDRVLTGARPFMELYSREEAFPRVNIWANGDRAIISADLPGIDPEQVDVSVLENSVTIRGARPSTEAGEKGVVTKRERPAGEFYRTVELPFSVQSERVEAGFRNGVLTVTLPRAEAEKPRKISVRSAGK